MSVLLWKKKKKDKHTKQKEEKIEGAFTLKFLIIFVIFNGPSIIKTQRHGGIRKKLNFLLGKPQENLTEKWTVVTKLNDPLCRSACVYLHVKAQGQDTETLYVPIWNSRNTNPLNNYQPQTLKKIKNPIYTENVIHNQIKYPWELLITTYKRPTNPLWQQNLIRK